MGDYNTHTMSVHSLADYHAFLKMSKTSILSFQKFFPKSRFVILYNGKNIDYFRENFERTGPSLFGAVEIINALDFRHSYHFSPDSGVWWKWVPFRFDENKTEINIDTDLICFNKPLFLEHFLTNDVIQMAFMSDPVTVFCEEVCGNMWQNKLLVNRIPINSGLAVFKPGITFEPEFYLASQQVQYGSNAHSLFLDEQGCFNIGLYTKNEKFALLRRRENIYGKEFESRMQKGVNIELCHFIGRSKVLFHALESYIFRMIHDKCYQMSDFYRDTSNVISLSSISLMNTAVYGCP